MVEKGKQVAKSQEHDLKIGNPSCQILSYLLVPISILYGTTGICGRDLGVTTTESTSSWVVKKSSESDAVLPICYPMTSHGSAIWLLDNRWIVHPIGYQLSIFLSVVLYQTVPGDKFCDGPV